MADVLLTVTIPDALVARTRVGLIAHYGLEDPTVQELKDYVEADIYEQIAKWVSIYEGSVAGGAAQDACMEDFGF